jgi:type VI protein secretion system component VasK
VKARRRIAERQFDQHAPPVHTDGANGIDQALSGVFVDEWSKQRAHSVLIKQHGEILCSVEVDEAAKRRLRARDCKSAQADLTLAGATALGERADPAWRSAHVKKPTPQRGRLWAFATKRGT